MLRGGTFIIGGSEGDGVRLEQETKHRIQVFLVLHSDRMQNKNGYSSRELTTMEEESRKIKQK